MKYLLLILTLFGCFGLSSNVIAQLTPEQREERCANNKKRLLELENELKIIKVDLDKSSSPQEIQVARDHLAKLRKLKTNIRQTKNLMELWDLYPTIVEMKRSINRYGDFELFDCTDDPNKENFKSRQDDVLICLNLIEKALIKEIEKLKNKNSGYEEKYNKKKNLDKMIAYHKNNIIALGCDGKASENGGSISAKVEVLRESYKKDYYGGKNYEQYEFSATGAKMIIQNDPPDRREITWEYEGIPSSLSPGDIITIKIKGGMSWPALGDPTLASAGLRVTGFEILQQEHAWVGKQDKKEGIYKLKYPANIKAATIELVADYGIGTFARYKYEK